MRQRIIITLAIAAVALVVATTASSSSTLTTTATVTGTAGVSLNLPSNPSVTTTLDGTDQTVFYAPVLGVVDARGDGTGWNLTIAATTFVSGTHTLAPGIVQSAAQACKAGSSCTAAVNSGVSLPLTLSSTANKFFNAALNSGLGQIDVTPTINVAIPGNAYAGTYLSTVTLATVVGP